MRVNLLVRAAQNDLGDLDSDKATEPFIKHGQRCPITLVINLYTNLGENKFSLPCKVDRSAIKVGFQFGTVTAPNRGGERISLSFDF